MDNNFNLKYAPYEIIEYLEITFEIWSKFEKVIFTSLDF